MAQMTAKDHYDSSSQVAQKIRNHDLSPDENILTDVLFQSFQSNIMPCKTYDFVENKFGFDDNISHFIIHFNIFSLQAHFDELRKLLQLFTCPPFMVFLSETRISINSFIDVELSNYTFANLPFPTKAGGVGANISKTLFFFSVNESLRLDAQEVKTHGRIYNSRDITRNINLL